MTIIVYRDGVVASDSEVQAYGVRCGDTRKIVKMPCGGVAGSSGQCTDGAAFRRWCEAGRSDDVKPSLGESFYGLVVEADRTIRIYEQRLGWFELAAPFHAIGSGHELAIGAMAAGASAIEAVKIAIQYESGCGGPVQVETVGGATQRDANHRARAQAMQQGVNSAWMDY